MPINSKVYQLQAIEAIKADTSSIMSLLLIIKQHPQAGALILGLLPQASMYVIESRRYLCALSPEIKTGLDKISVDCLLPPRYRAKLLDDSKKSLKEIANTLVVIVEQQHRIFLEPHKGSLGPLKRSIQPDLGLSTYDNHIFSTTHSSAFNFGEECDYRTRAFTIGEQLSAYTSSLVNSFQLNTLTRPSILTSSGMIEMWDIKSNTLYQRGILGKLSVDLAASLTFLLASLNYIRYVIPPLLTDADLTLFRFKFIVAFHANENLQTIRNLLVSDSSISPEALAVLNQALDTPESQWLQEHIGLRNLLVHYAASTQLKAQLPQNATRKATIEYLSSNLSFDQVNVLLDRYITYVSHSLENGFNLSGNPFWYGQVK